MKSNYSLINNKKYKSEIEKHLASFLIDLGYKLVNTKKNEFTFESENRKIIVNNEAKYTDYGFSIFIQKNDKKNKHDKLVINVPWEKQDINQNYLRFIVYKIMESKNILDIIVGRKWINQKIDIKLEKFWLFKKCFEIKKNERWIYCA